MFYLLDGFFMPIKCVQLFPSHIQQLCLVSFLLLCKKVSKLEPVRIYIQILIYCVAFFQLTFHFENNFEKHQLQTHPLHFFLHVSILNFLHQWLATTQFAAHMESMHIGSKPNSRESVINYNFSSFIDWLHQKPNNFTGFEYVDAGI